MDEPGSGHAGRRAPDPRPFGMTDKDIKAEDLCPNPGRRHKLKDGGLDAFFFVGGAPPARFPNWLSSGAGIELVPIVGPEIDSCAASRSSSTPDTIAANTYQNVGEVKTIRSTRNWSPRLSCPSRPSMTSSRRSTATPPARRWTMAMPRPS